MNPDKLKASVYTKILTVYNIDNNQKCLLSSESHIIIISEEHENTALITEINDSLTHSQRKLLFYILIIFHSFYCIYD